MRDLEFAVRAHALLGEDAVRGGHVEEGAGGDRDHEKNCYLYALLDDGFWGRLIPARSAGGYLARCRTV